MTFSLLLARSPSMPLSSRISSLLLRDISQDKHKFFLCNSSRTFKIQFFLSFFFFFIAFCTLSIYSSSLFNVCASSKYLYVHNTHDIKMVEIKCKIGQLNFDIRPFCPSRKQLFHSLNFACFVLQGCQLNAKDIKQKRW